jgi:hypothetical protein
MKATLSLLGFWLATSVAANAQLVNVELVSTQDRFLPNEKLTICVRVINQSGQTLTFGHDEQWVKFVVERSDRRHVSTVRTMQVATKEPFLALTATSSKVCYDLAPYFDLTEQGTYTITALVKCKQLPDVFGSSPKRIEIVKGIIKWEQEFGVSGATASTPELRKYTLETLRSGGATSMATRQLYARVSNASGTLVYGVEPIGTMLAFSEPIKRQIDNRGHLHVLYLNGQHNYLYTIINPDGETVWRKNYTIVNRSGPNLQMGPSGEITVVGGVLRPSPYDFPPPAAGTQPSPASAPSP